MSNALNLIIARGFPEMGTAVQDGYNQQKDTLQRREANDVSIAGARQNQQFNADDQARQVQEHFAQQGAEAEIQALGKAAEELAQMDPADPKVQNALKAIYLRAEALRGGSGTAMQGIMQPKPASRGSAVKVMGQNGQPSFAYTEDAVSQGLQPYEKPQASGGGVPQSEPLVAVQGPDGPVMMPRSQAAGMAPAQKPQAPAPTISPKDMAVAKNKRTQISAARKQLAVVQEKFNALKDGLSAGPAQGLLPTPSGRAFDAAVNQLRNLQTSVTRVPGVGAMSDFENRLANAALPTRNEYEEVTQQQIDGLKDLLDTLDNGYVELLTPQQQGQPSGGQAGELYYIPGQGLVRK